MRIQKQETNEFYHAKATLLGMAYDPDIHWFMKLNEVVRYREYTYFHPDNLEEFDKEFRHVWMGKLWRDK